MELVESIEEIAANTCRFDRYRISGQTNARDFYAQMLRLGKIFVVCIPHEGQVLFCPSRFVGYINNTMAKHVAFKDKDGSRTTPRISKLLGPHVSNRRAEDAYLALCEEIGIKPSTKVRTYWQIDADFIPDDPLGGESGFPDEVSTSEGYSEGAVKRVFVNAYERNHEARRACVEHYGVKCVVCDFDFEAVYGITGRGFIHVHHLTSIALLRAEYNVNPIRDLKPVCPNCHAMLHKSDPPFAIEELIILLASQDSNI